MRDWKFRLRVLRKAGVWALHEFGGSFIMKLILRQRKSRHSQTLHAVVEHLLVWPWQRKNPMPSDLLVSDRSGWVKVYGHCQWIYTGHGWWLSLDLLVYKMTGHPLGLWVSRLWLEKAGEDPDSSLDLSNVDFVNFIGLRNPQRINWAQLQVYLWEYFQREFCHDSSLSGSTDYFLMGHTMAVERDGEMKEVGPS